MSRHFVIAVASEKGGVGKTTIATNLAVYLKALHEDLPVTIASFDNHFSIDQMFALGPRPQESIVGLLQEQPPDELVNLGQYGVQYLASARRLASPTRPPQWLRGRLDAVLGEGITILDTRPILDWFTEAALLAADLVLVPIKDRAALVNAAALREVLVPSGRLEKLWLVPSLVDTRARLNGELRVHEFLAYSAKERDYQVVDLHISKSPKVEGLASGFSSRIRPVLTHARNTAVHGQFKGLADFVLSRYDSKERYDSTETPASATARNRRQVLECPCCNRQVISGSGHFYFDLRSRRRGFMHPGCFSELFDDSALCGEEGSDSLMALTIDGPGLLGPESRISRHFLMDDGGPFESEELQLNSGSRVEQALEEICGRSLTEAYRDLIFVNCSVSPADPQSASAVYKAFAFKRRHVLKALRQEGLY